MADQQQSIRSQMGDEGVTEGTLVEITLKESAEFAVCGATFFFSDKPDSDPIKHASYAGYTVDINKDGFGLILGYDQERKGSPRQGHAGGIRFYWDAVKSYRKLSE